MAVRKWTSVPGGRPKHWKKSRGDTRPGWATTQFGRQVPPHWYRNTLNRRERRRVFRAVARDEAERWPYVHPREAGWYW